MCFIKKELFLKSIAAELTIKSTAMKIILAVEA